MKLSNKIRKDTVQAMIESVFAGKIAKFEANSAKFIKSVVMDKHQVDIEWSLTLNERQGNLVIRQTGFTVSYSELYKDTQNTSRTLFQPKIEVLALVCNSSGNKTGNVICKIGQCRHRSYTSDLTKVETGVVVPAARSHIEFTHDCEADKENMLMLKALIAEKLSIQKTIVNVAKQAHEALLSVPTYEKAAELMPDLAKFIPIPKPKVQPIVPAELYNNINNLLSGIK